MSSWPHNEPRLLFRRCLILDDPAQNTECLATQLQLLTLGSHDFLARCLKTESDLPFHRKFWSPASFVGNTSNEQALGEDAEKLHRVQKMVLGTREDKKTERNGKWLALSGTTGCPHTVVRDGLGEGLNN